MNWYKTNCDGDWEHSYGITLQTLDNPGWHLTVDLQCKQLKKVVIPMNRFGYTAKFLIISFPLHVIQIN